MQTRIVRQQSNDQKLDEPQSVRDQSGQGMLKHDDTCRNKFDHHRRHRDDTDRWRIGSF